MQHTAWKDFNTGVWDKAVDVRDFIQRNYIPYEGDDSFLAGPTERTTKLWDQVMKLYEEEREKGGMIDADTSVATHITAHAPGYIDKDLETIVGLQTDKPLKRVMGACVLRNPLLKNTASKWIRKQKTSSKNIVKLTMMAYLMYIHQKCVPLVQLIS